MLRNFYIFNSKHSRFLAVFGLFIVSIVVIVPLVTLTAYRLGLVKYPFNQLYLYQLDKIKRIQDAEILFFGDSSLGNAIDAKQLSSNLDMKAYSLALTGNFGYAGSYNMLKRALKKSNPRVVVICQWPAMMASRIAHKSYIFTLEKISLSDINIHLFQAYVDIDAFQKTLKDILNLSEPEKEADISRTDYYPQDESVEAIPSAPEMTAADVNPDKAYYLEKIAELCKANNITLIYMHGPWEKDHILASKDYLEEANSVIQKTGAILATETPIPLSHTQVGDTVNHVHPRYKELFTDKYSAILESTLFPEQMQETPHL